MAELLDTGCYDKRRRDWLADEDARAEYERAREEIERRDAVEADAPRQSPSRRRA